MKLIPITITDPDDNTVKSVWAAEKSFLIFSY